MKGRLHHFPTYHIILRAILPIGRRSSRHCRRILLSLRPPPYTRSDAIQIGSSLAGSVPYLSWVNAYSDCFFGSVLVRGFCRVTYSLTAFFLEPRIFFFLSFSFGVFCSWSFFLFLFLFNLVSVVRLLLGCRSIYTVLTASMTQPLLSR